MKTTKQKLQVTHKNKSFGKDGKLEFEVDVQEAESFTESVSWAGGEEKVREILNWTALARAKSKIRSEANATVADGEKEKTLDEFLSAVETIISEMKPVAGRSGLSAKAKAENFDTFAEKLQKRLTEAKESGLEVPGDEILEIARSLGMGV